MMMAVRAQVAAMVHPSAQAEARLRQRHERFMLTRLGAGAAAFALLPAYLAWRGRLETLELLGLVAISLPLLAAVLLSRTGRLGLAHAISAAALTLLVACIAAATGGLASPALLLLALVPAESLLAGARRDGLRDGAIALCALPLLAMLAGPGPVAGLPLWLVAAVPALAIGLVAGAGFGRLGRPEAAAIVAPSSRPDGRTLLTLDHVGDLVTWHDAAGGVLFASAAARDLAGAAPADLLGRGLFERVHIADRPLFLKALSDAAHGEGRAGACIRVLFLAPAPEDGIPAPVVRWLDLQASRVTGGEDGAAVVCVSRDVTERCEREQLRERDQAPRVRELKSSQFLATVSHELRTPLNAIIGFSEMLGGELADTLDDRRRKEYACLVRDAGHHLLEVVNALLDVSKMESGAMTIERDTLDVAKLAEECCAVLALKAESGAVTLERVVGPGLPALVGDKRALKQIMFNLLSNAIKFTPPGGRVTLALVRDGGMLDLSVSDTGIGIAANDLPKLGDPFFQVCSAYDRPHDGTGLGLSVVRGLVGLHGGTVGIESAPGVGTRVAVRLPLSGAAETAEPVRIATHARAPRRGLETKQPFRLTA